MTIDLERIVGPVTSVPILIFTRSHPRSLLSIARSKSARSRIRPSRSRKKRIDHTCLIFRARFAPTCLPAFQAGLPAAAGSYCEIPITFLLWPKWPAEERLSNGPYGRGHQRSPKGQKATDPLSVIGSHPEICRKRSVGARSRARRSFTSLRLAVAPCLPYRALSRCTPTIMATAPEAQAAAITIDRPSTVTASHLVLIRSEP